MAFWGESGYFEWSAFKMGRFESIFSGEGTVSARGVIKVRFILHFGGGGIDGTFSYKKDFNNFFFLVGGLSFFCVIGKKFLFLHFFSGVQPGAFLNKSLTEIFSSGKGIFGLFL